jgi:hypothetical protein
MRKCATDTIQAFRKDSRVYAHPDAKVFGHFEKATGNCGSIEF